MIATEGKNEKRMKRTEESLRYLWDNIKRTNIHIIGIPEGEEREKGPEKIFKEIITENFPNMGKEILTRVAEAQRIPYGINLRRKIARHVLNKQTKVKYKEKILKAARENQQIIYKGNLIRIKADFFFQQKLCKLEGSIKVSLR
uniref:L1 transposable element RRM domain-containing protein n=1 Tax=Sus scrofa TaxID=9823 RepID=A0A8D1RJ36_PIG